MHSVPEILDGSGGVSPSLLSQPGSASLPCLCHTPHLSSCEAKGDQQNVRRSDEKRNEYFRTNCNRRRARPSLRRIEARPTRPIWTDGHTVDRTEAAAAVRRHAIHAVVATTAARGQCLAKLCAKPVRRHSVRRRHADAIAAH